MEFIGRIGIRVKNVILCCKFFIYGDKIKFIDVNLYIVIIYEKIIEGLYYWVVVCAEKLKRRKGRRREGEGRKEGERGECN